MVVILHSMTVQQGSEIKTKVLMTSEIKKLQGLNKQYGTEKNSMRKKVTI